VHFDVVVVLVVLGKPLRGALGLNNKGMVCQF
jgi:hypothetical protein